MVGCYRAKIPEWFSNHDANNNTVYAVAQAHRRDNPIVTFHVDYVAAWTCWFCVCDNVKLSKYYIDRALSEQEVATVDPMVRLYDAYIIAGEDPPAELVARLCAIGE